MSATVPRRPTYASRSAAGPWFGTLLRLVLGGVLLAAGGLKLLDSHSSVRAVQAYELFPLPVAELIGYALPPTEVALGLLLLVGLWTRPAAVAAGVLMVAFVLGVGSAWARGLSIDCGCFGGGGAIAPDATRYAEEIARDVALAAAAGWLAVRPWTRLALDRPAPGRPARPAAAPPGAAGRGTPPRQAQEAGT